MQQQRGTGKHDDEGAGDYRHAMALEKMVERRKPLKADRRGLAAGRSKASIAGTSVMLQRKAISMPQPAIRPSSESPR